MILSVFTSVPFGNPSGSGDGSSSHGWCANVLTSSPGIHQLCLLIFLDFLVLADLSLMIAAMWAFPMSEILGSGLPSSPNFGYLNGSRFGVESIL